MEIDPQNKKALAIVFFQIHILEATTETIITINKTKAINTIGPQNKKALDSRLGLNWSKLSDQKASKTTFAFLHKD